MDRKLMIFIHLVAFVFASTDGRAVINDERKPSPVDTTDDEDYNEASGEKDSARNGSDLFVFGGVTDPSENIDDSLFDPEYGLYGVFEDDCDAMRALNVNSNKCPLSVSDIPSTYQSHVSETTNSIVPTTTIQLTPTSKEIIEATMKVGEIGTESGVIHSNDASDDSRSRSALPESHTDANVITQPAKRQSTTKIDTTRAALVVQAKIDDAFISTEVKSLVTAANSSSITHPTKSEREQHSIESFSQTHSTLATAGTTETFVTPLVIASDDTYPASATEKPIETPTTPLLIVSGNTHSTSATETTTQTSATPLVIVSYGFDKFAREGPDDFDVEPSVASEVPAKNRNADVDVIVSQSSMTTRIVATENAVRIDSGEVTEVNQHGNVLNSTSAEVRTIYRSKPNIPTASSARSSQHPGTESAETLQYARTTQVDFDLKTKKIARTLQSTRSPLPSVLTTNIAGGPTMLDQLLTVTTKPQEAPSKKKPASEETEVLQASTAFPTTVLIICVVAAVIVLVIIVVLIVILRGRMNKNGKYNITSEMNSIVGDESGSPSAAKVVKVHYNDTKA